MRVCVCASVIVYWLHRLGIAQVSKDVTMFIYCLLFIIATALSYVCCEYLIELFFRCC